MTPGEYEQLLHDAEVRLSRVKALYEQFFQGLEKLEPTVPRKELDRVLEILRKQQPRNTALRFRTQMLVARYGTYQTYWQRIARQIEEGTYRRDVVRVQQKRRREQAQAQAQTREEPSAWEIDVDVDAIEEASLAFDESDVDAILGALSAKKDSIAPGRRLSPFASALPPAPGRSIPAPGGSAPPKPAVTSFAKPVATFGKPGTATFAKPAATPPQQQSPAPRPAEPPRPMPAAAPPPAAARPRSPDALDEARMRNIYDSYVDARRRNNERVDTVKYETVKQSMQQMMPKLREKHGDRAIDFEVVVQNGKVGLKPKVGA